MELAERMEQQGPWAPYRVEDRKGRAPFAQEEGPSENHLASCQQPETAKPLHRHTALEKAHHPKKRMGYPLPDHMGLGRKAQGRIAEGRIASGLLHPRP